MEALEAIFNRKNVVNKGFGEYISRKKITQEGTK